MQVIWKILGGLILLFGVLVLVYSYKDVLPFLDDGTPEERLSSLWERDIIQLTAAGKLPKEFFETKEIKITYGSDRAKWLIQAAKSPLHTVADGKYRLDFFADHYVDGKDFGVVLQYQLVDLTSNDMIWELGRTLKLGETQTVEKPKAPGAAAAPKSDTGAGGPPASAGKPATTPPTGSPSTTMSGSELEN